MVEHVNKCPGSGNRECARCMGDYYDFYFAECGRLKDAIEALITAHKNNVAFVADLCRGLGKP